VWQAAFTRKKKHTQNTLDILLTHIWPTGSQIAKILSQLVLKYKHLFWFFNIIYYYALFIHNYKIFLRFNQEKYHIFYKGIPMQFTEKRT